MVLLGPHGILHRAIRPAHQYTRHHRLLLHVQPRAPLIPHLREPSLSRRAARRGILRITQFPASADASLLTPPDTTTLLFFWTHPRSA